MSSTPGEFVCVAGGQVNGVKAEAVIYHDTGRKRGTPVYFVPAAIVQSSAPDRGLNAALTDFAKKYLPEGVQDRFGVGSVEKWGRMAMADPGHNPLKLNNQDGLNLVYDRHGKLKECFIANDAMLEPDFTTRIDVADKPPAAAAPPASAPSLAPAR